MCRLLLMSNSPRWWAWVGRTQRLPEATTAIVLPRRQGDFQGPLQVRELLPEARRRRRRPRVGAPGVRNTNR
jgi:hypothetical protein